MQIYAVRSVVPNKSNNEIVLVLQQFDFNVDKAVQAFVDGKYPYPLNEKIFELNPVYLGFFLLYMHCMPIIYSFLVLIKTFLTFIIKGRIWKFFFHH